MLKTIHIYSESSLDVLKIKQPVKKLTYAKNYNSLKLILKGFNVGKAVNFKLSSTKPLELSQ